MAKLLNSQLQAWEMMPSQHAMHQPLTGLESDAIPECNAANTPHKRDWRSSEKGRWEEGRDFYGS